ncbi:hypothetical protein BJF79_03670 [Actinomadura sp. CNU-125]|nr:hypothetical protein BJF79_03670 [Actinomadura sp. CNU-125]
MVERQETEPAGDGDETGEQQPQEGSKATGEPFDEARAQAKIRKANQEAANLRKRLKELEPLAEEARQAKAAQQTEAERLQSQLGEKEQQIGALRARAVKSEVRALAAATFADPTDPEALLDLTSYATDDGDIDTDAIKVDLADLLERKPHLGKPKPTEPEQRRRPAPDRTQASGANQPRVKDPADEFAGFVNSRLLKSKGR